MSRKYFIIAALSQNNVIGKNGKIPWHLKTDLLRFKKITENHPIIMGRKTYDTFIRPLPNRLHIVISSKPVRLRSNAVFSVRNINEAFDFADQFENGSNLGFIIGGGQIYSQLIDDERICGLILTKVKANVENGDAFFPDINYNMWNRICAINNIDDEFNDYCSTFEIYINKNESLENVKELKLNLGL